MMVQVTFSLVVSTSPAWAEAITCQMESGSLEFAIDYNDFAPSWNANDPPRRATTIVSFGNEESHATPFILGDAKGFEVDRSGLHQVFVVQADGSAVFSDLDAGLKMTGTCVFREGLK